VGYPSNRDGHPLGPGPDNERQRPNSLSLRFARSEVPADAVDLSVQICACRLRNHILCLPADTFGYGLEIRPPRSSEPLGGFVVKGISREPIRRCPCPPPVRDTLRHAPNDSRLEEYRVRAFRTEKLPRHPNNTTKRAGTVFGSALAGYVDYLLLAVV